MFNRIDRRVQRGKKGVSICHALSMNLCRNVFCDLIFKVYRSAVLMHTSNISGTLQVHHPTDNYSNMNTKHSGKLHIGYGHGRSPFGKEQESAY